MVFKLSLFSLFLSFSVFLSPMLEQDETKDGHYRVLSLSLSLEKSSYSG